MMELCRIRTFQKSLLRPLLLLQHAPCRTLQTLGRSPSPSVFRPPRRRPPLLLLLLRSSFASVSPGPAPGSGTGECPPPPPAPLPPDELASDDDSYYHEHILEATQEDQSRLVPVKAYFPCTRLLVASLLSSPLLRLHPCDSIP